jgi:hypothetical protein
LFSGFSNEIRLSLFIQGSQELMDQGKTIENSLKDYQDLASKVNNLTGRGETMFKSSKSIQSAVLWSPKLLASTLNKLDSLGFRTFVEYLKIPNYSDIQNPYDRLDAIIINAKYWLTTIKHDKIAIEQDVKHNYYQLCQLINKDLTNLTIICDSVDITIESLMQLGFLSDIVDMPWILFYNSVKDDSWPICLNENSFHHLPVSIKQELVEIFGFCPNTTEKE